ncbi:hypothetical protein TrispH2_008911 [Trichoplax sp. H2]|nr:hypothetical protein TrispH2_008911 [Trichoplax sp. H2]|eukprot:RDD38705.1 hypothetical protein TrispH2_008911 [Trichoplax sp. H2]
MGARIGYFPGSILFHGPTNGIDPFSDGVLAMLYAHDRNSFAWLKPFFDGVGTEKMEIRCDPPLPCRGLYSSSTI